jgi:hypothetical protein
MKFRKVRMNCMKSVNFSVTRKYSTGTEITSHNTAQELELTHPTLHITLDKYIRSYTDTLTHILSLSSHDTHRVIVLYNEYNFSRAFKHDLDICVVDHNFSFDENQGGWFNSDESC